jgi:hypothetical protein
MPYYEAHLGPRRFRHQVVVEIGVGNIGSSASGGSLTIWRDYMIRSIVVGIDIEPKVIDFGRRVHFAQADQANCADLQRVVDIHGPPDVVIDDGSHIADHVLASFSFLWPLLSPGGLYIIEDLCTSYYASFGGADPPPRSSAVGLVQHLVDCVQAEDPTFVRRPELGARSEPRHSGVRSVHVYPGIAFIEKSNA